MADIKEKMGPFWRRKKAPAGAEPNKEKKEKRAELQEKMWALVGKRKK